MNVKAMLNAFVRAYRSEFEEYTLDDMIDYVIVNTILSVSKVEQYYDYRLLVAYYRGQADRVERTAMKNDGNRPDLASYYRDQAVRLEKIAAYYHEQAKRVETR